MNTPKKYYRVEKFIIRDDDNGSIYEQLHRSRTFDSLDEAKQYFDESSSVYKIKLYEVQDLILEEREPYEEPWDEEAKAQLRITLGTLGNKFTDEEWEQFLLKVEEQCGQQNT